jgi:hypothetical protein
MRSYISIDRQSEAIYQWTDNQKLYINGQTIRSCISMDRQSEAVYQWTDNDKNKKTTGKTNDLQNTTQKTKY